MANHFIQFMTRGEKPLYMQLYEYFKEEINSGRLESNTKIASIRELSSQLQVSKNTVETAYQQLSAEGYLVSKPKRGYYVCAVEKSPFLRHRALVPVKEETGDSKRPSVEYNLKSDHIDQESFDFSIWKRFINKALRNTGRYLTYGNHQGEYDLRLEIAKYLRQSRGVVCCPEQVVIGAGVQSLLHILCSLLELSAKYVAFEDPGFKKAQYIFRDRGYTIVPIPHEKDGINIRLLTDSKAKVVYVSPSHQFPMGTVMPISKRTQLLKWAYDNKGIIIEDDYDSELRYFGKPLPSLQGLDSGTHVVYLGTFSKILLPSLRISYMVLPYDILSRYEANMSRYNQTSSTIEQIALSLFMKEGYLERSIRRLRKLYARKNQLVIEAINKTMKDRVMVHGKETGLHLLIEIKTDLSIEQIVSSANQVGVKIMPVTHFYIDKTEAGNPQILLAYGGIPGDKILPAVELLNYTWFGVKPFS